MKNHPSLAQFTLPLFHHERGWNWDTVTKLRTELASIPASLIASSQRKQEILCWLTLMYEATGYSNASHEAAAYLLESLFQIGNKDFSGELLKMLDEVSMAIAANPMFLSPERKVLGHRIPSLPEAAIESVRRLKIIALLQNNISKSIIGQAIGGSMNYGLFYNVRKESDIDILWIVKDIEPNILDYTPWVEDSEAKALNLRLNYTRRYINNEIVIISHPIRFQSTNIQITLNLISKDDFIRLFQPYDFKYIPRVSIFLNVTSFKSFETRKSITGKVLKVPYDQVLTPAGLSISLPAYSIIDRHILLGGSQLFIFPFVEIRTTDQYIHSVITNFRASIAKMEQAEYLYGNEDARLVKTHIRYPLFSRLVINEVYSTCRCV